ncbi:MAG: tyrosine-type recombinase/integrase, partial [Actinomycetota bacterium]
LNKVLATLGTGTYVEPDRITVAGFLQDQWLPAIRQGVRPSTLASYEMNVRQHIAPVIGAVPLQQLTPDRLNVLYADLLAAGRRDGKGLSPKTVRNIHVIIRKALADAVRWGRVVRNVAELADPPRLRASKRPAVVTWNAAELRSFLESVASEPDSCLWLTYATTGMRRGEALALRWSDLDLDAKRAHVGRQLVSVNYVLHFSEPKTARGRRAIDLDAATGGALRAHRKRQLEERLALGPHYQDGDLVFARADGASLHPQAVSDRFDKLVAGSQLPRIRLHDLRHTHATLTLKAGVPVKVVSERLGHASTSFTMDVYAHVLPGMQAEAAETFAALIAAPLRPSVSDS